jgi:RNA polymerase sigma-70 factor (ECF subfamily)
MNQEHRSAAVGHFRFDATHWSVVLEAALSRAPGGPEALARLCEHYWSPLYAFASHRGFSPEDAQDLVQGLFAHLIQRRGLLSVDRSKARFRSFLLASFQNFIAAEIRRTRAEKRGGCVEVVRLNWRTRRDAFRWNPSTG